jgi:hypothetical protein
LLGLFRIMVTSLYTAEALRRGVERVYRTQFSADIVTSSFDDPMVTDGLHEAIILLTASLSIEISTRAVAGNERPV